MTILLDNNHLSPAEIKDFAKIRAQRLLGLKNHLLALVAKKVRLELEIKHLKEVIKNKGTRDAKKLRVSLSLEDSQSVNQDPDLLNWVKGQPEILQELQVGDQILKEVLDLLQEEGLLSEEEFESFRQSL